MYVCLCFVQGARQRLLLYTVFALSEKYGPMDVALAISRDLLPLLSKLCGSPATLSKVTSTVVYNSGQSQISTVLQVASMRLLQILAISAG